jgi:hypothetical protein
MSKIKFNIEKKIIYTLFATYLGINFQIETSLETMTEEEALSLCREQINCIRHDHDKCYVVEIYDDSIFDGSAASKYDSEENIILILLNVNTAQDAYLSKKTNNGDFINSSSDFIKGIECIEAAYDFSLQKETVIKKMKNTFNS